MKQATSAEERIIALLGLEVLVAADIVRTVAVAPTLTDVADLAGIGGQLMGPGIANLATTFDMSAGRQRIFPRRASQSRLVVAWLRNLVALRDRPLQTFPSGHNPGI